MQVVIDGKFVIPATMIDKITEVRRVGSWQNQLFTPVKQTKEVMLVNECQILTEQEADAEEAAEDKRLAEEAAAARKTKAVLLQDQMIDVSIEDIMRFLETKSDTWWINKATAEEADEWLNANPATDENPA